MLTAVDRLAKGIMAVMHEVALLHTEVSALRKANKGLSKRRRVKKTRVQLGGSLTVQEAQDLLDQKAVGEQLAQKTRQGGNGAGGSRAKIRCCGVCGKPGHNARMCKENCLIHLFPIQLLLFLSVVVVELRIDVTQG